MTMTESTADNVIEITCRLRDGRAVVRRKTSSSGAMNTSTRFRKRGAATALRPSRSSPQWFG
jgi:hypothetical protein